MVFSALQFVLWSIFQILFVCWLSNVVVVFICLQQIFPAFDLLGVHLPSFKVSKSFLTLPFSLQCVPIISWMFLFRLNTAIRSFLKIYIYIYIFIYMVFIHHWRILWSSYRKLAWVGFKPTTSEFRSDALTEWAIRPWVQLALRANFVQLLQFHRLFSVTFHFGYCLRQWPRLFELKVSWLR